MEDEVEWLNAVASQRCQVKPDAVESVQTLLNDGCTVAFIARYRCGQTGGLEPAKIRDIRDCLDDLRHVRTKVRQMGETNMKTLNTLRAIAEGRLQVPLVEQKILERSVIPPKVLTALHSCTSMEDVTELAEPFLSKRRGRTDLARDMGLDRAALLLLQGSGRHLCSFQTLSVNYPEVAANYNKSQARELLFKLLAHRIARDPVTLQTVKKLTLNMVPLIRSSLRPRTMKSDERNFENYFDFKRQLSDLRAHQVMALNRGEAEKVLTIDIDYKEAFFRTLTEWMSMQFESLAQSEPSPNESPFIFALLPTTVDLAIQGYIKPSLTRRIRSCLTQAGRKSAVEVFQKNLRHLLLTPPLTVGRGNCLLAIDPGYAAAKCAVLDCDGRPLQWKVVRLFERRNEGRATKDIGKRELEELIDSPTIRVVAIGDGQAARETELLVSSIRQNSKPFDMEDEGSLWRFTTVAEAGVSIWSASAAADAEFPNLAPGVRSAISLGRRLLDPLGEYTKVEPQHLGVGMYQLDVPEDELKRVLAAVTEECVSMAGVDLNTAPLHLLSYVAGLGVAKAKAVVEYREKCGGFQSRQQLLNVKGLGPKTFQQSAGFLRIREGTEPLDRTWIHPEQYPAARELIKLTKFSEHSIGTPEFIVALQTQLRGADAQNVCGFLGLTATEDLDLILKGLLNPLGQDNVHEGLSPPLLKDRVLGMEDLKIGMRLPGRVMNKTPFGAFIDIGVETSGLLHHSRVGATLLEGLPLGQTLEVEVERVETDRDRPRIGLRIPNCNQPPQAYSEPSLFFADFVALFS